MSNTKPVISEEEKNKFINEFKRTINDIPLFLRWLLKPLLWSIEKKYDNLTPKQKEKLHKLNQDIKDWKVRTIDWIKNILWKIKWNSLYQSDKLNPSEKESPN